MDIVTELPKTALNGQQILLSQNGKFHYYIYVNTKWLHIRTEDPITEPPLTLRGRTMSDGKTSLNLELLIKLLKLTTSSNDGEALLASRKANEVLGKFGGDWEALLRGKVTVIADPFTASVTPAQNQFNQHRPPPPAPHPKPAPGPTMQPPRPTYAPNPAPQQPRPQPAAQQWTPPGMRARAQAAQQRAAAAAAAQTTASPQPTRNTLRKQRISLDDLA